MIFLMRLLLAEILCDIVNSLGKECKVIIENNGMNSVVERQIPNLEKLKSLGWEETRGDLKLNFQKMIKYYLNILED